MPDFLMDWYSPSPCRALARRLVEVFTRRRCPAGTHIPAGVEKKILRPAAWKQQAVAVVTREGQKCFFKPACESISLAVCRFLVVLGTTTFFWLIGENQISWLPLPCRTNLQPA